jgi:D-alanine-D-alanine ligase
MSARAAGIAYEDLCLRVLATATLDSGTPIRSEAN